MACFSHVLQPEIAGNPAVVLVDLAVALPPVVELTGRDAEPLDEPPGADLGLLRPAPDEIHDLVPHIVRDPDPGQSSPRLFFSATCSAISSARTSSLVWIFFSRYSMRSCSADGWAGPSAGRRPPRSRRTPSASDRRPSAAAPVHRTGPRSATSPANAASEWRLSLLPCSASVASSCVLSVILTAERFLHFQLRQDTSRHRRTSTALSWSNSRAF